MAEPDEEVIIRYIVDVDKAAGEAQRMRDIIDQTKKNIRDLAADGKLSFESLGRAITESLKAMTLTKDRADLAKFLKIKPEEIKSTQEFGRARAQATNLVTTALRELAEEQRAQAAQEKSYSDQALEGKKEIQALDKVVADQQKKDSQELAAEQKKNATDAANLVKELAANRARAEQEYISKVAQGYRGTLSPAAREYGKEIDAIKQKLMSLQTPMGSDYQLAGQDLISKGFNADQVTQAIKEIRKEEEALAALRKKTLAEQIDAQKLYEQVTKQGYGTLTPLAVQYGQAVQGIKNAILAQAQASGQTYQQVAKQMSNAGVAANVLKTALGEIAREEAAVAAATKAAKDAEIAIMNEYVRITKQGYGQMSAEAVAFGQQVAQVKQQIQAQASATGQTYQQIAQQMSQAGTNANVLKTAMNELTAAAKRTQQGFAGLGNTIVQVFIVGLGINVFNIIRQIIALFGRAAESGFELARSFFLLEVGIRALRRAGVDIATQEMLDNLDQLSAKFGVFSKKELVEGSAAFVNLVRDMGFTKEQIFELQDAIATLAVVNGRSMDEVQKTVALALSSGYTEGLQRLGVSINRVNIAQRAMSMGFAEGYMNLSEFERSQATGILLLEKTALFQDDLIEYQKTEAGQLDILTAKQKDQTALLGDRLLPLQIEYNKAVLVMLEQLTDILVVLNPAITAMVMLSEQLDKIQQLGFLDWMGSLGETLKGVYQSFKMLFAPIQFVFFYINKMTEAARDAVEGLRYFETLKLPSWAETTQKVIGKLADSLERLFRIKPEKIFDEEVDVGTPNLNADKMDDALEKFEDNVKGLYDDIQKETRNFNNRMDDAWRDLSRDLDAIDRDLTRDLLEIWRDYHRDRAKIIEDGNRKADKENRDYAQKQDDVERDYQNDLADENRDFQNDEAKAARDFQRDEEEAARKFQLKEEEAERKYKDRQIQAEIEYQERLRKLREGFLFDLEDALRERDARQVLNLIRRYNLEQDQTARQYAQDNEERARQYALEKEERARQYAEEQAERRRRFADEQAERALQHQIRLQDMAREREERLAEMALEHQQKLDEIARETAAELEERKIQYELEKEDRRRRAEEAKADRQLRYQQQLEELKIEHQQRLQEIIAALSEEEGMTAEMLNRIGLRYRAMYGPNGQIEGYIRYYIGMLRALAVQQQTMMASLSSVPVQYRNRYPGTTPSVGRQAEGGTYYANSPTHAIFGDAGPEIAHFIPLNKMGRGGSTAVGGVAPTGRKDSIVLRVGMEPGLIAEIQENTLDRAADILMEVQRSAR